jgi:hypothetical protein
MKTFILILTLITAFTTIGNAQTNLIKNPSFEWYQFLPQRISDKYLPDYTGQGWYDEITRCLGDYILNQQTSPRYYPNPDNRPFSKSSSFIGCDGWYNPKDETKSTPDYFNRQVISNDNINDNFDKDVDVPNNFVNNFGNNVNYKQEPFDDNNNSIVDATSSGYEGENAYIGIANQRVIGNPYGNESEYITQNLSIGGNQLIAHK